jgi:hypothetical protein
MQATQFSGAVLTLTSRTLPKIPLSKLWSQNYKTLEETSVWAAYVCQMYSRRPIEKPISVDGNGLIVDGRHRVVAATLRGDVEIEANGV